METVQKPPYVWTRKYLIQPGEGVRRGTKCVRRRQAHHDCEGPGACWPISAWRLDKIECHYEASFWSAGGLAG